ncbi:hypothetical protein [Streptomyces synnematoformans]|uniref:Secreted protein n=1 Tax=Streptomyces synnematoformans TaxID=415721 RepID=A0ABP5IWJ1_9ACTN
MFKEGSRIFGFTIAGIAAAALLYVVGVFAVGGAAWFTAPFRGEVDARERTEGSGAFRITSYEEFFDLCTAAQDAEDQIAALTEELDTQPPEERVTRINTSITAARAARADAINDYNSLAAQEHKAAFHDADLPARLDKNAEETLCAA